MEEFQPSWWLIATYLLLMFGIGIWAARTRVGRMEDMAVAGRSSGPWLIAFSVAATWINGTTLIGISGVAKDFGLSAYWTGGSFVLATIWMSYYVVPRLRATRIITVPQLFERFYGPRHRLVSLSLIILRDLGATAGVMGSLAVVTSSILQISLLQSLALVGALTLVYVFLGGMWAILVTDAIQFFIVSIGSVALVVFGFLGAGGFSVLRSIEDPDFLGSFGTGGPSQVIAWVIIGISITFGYQSVIQRGLAASSTAAAHKGFLYGGIISTIWYMVPPLIGVLGRALYGADISGDDVFLQMTFGVAGGQLGSIIIVGILAASMSTLDSTINTIASNFTIDIYNRFLNPNASPRAQLWLYRLNVILVGALAAAIYYVFPLMIELFWLGGRIMGASVAPVVAAMVLFPRVRRAPRTVLTSMLTGASVIILYQVLGSVQEVGTIVVVWTIDPILIGVPITVSLLALGTWWETRDARPIRPDSSEP
ncbi:MAG: sodium:solute symporter family protein [Acidobacteriota bacterium]|nr:sodium:solute symporter family protein [Acidobacteriota bacterium]